MQQPERIRVLHYILEIEHSEYGVDTTHRYYYNCTYEEGLEFATKYLEKSGWKILSHNCENITVYDFQSLKD